MNELQEIIKELKSLIKSAKGNYKRYLVKRLERRELELYELATRQ